MAISRLEERSRRSTRITPSCRFPLALPHAFSRAYKKPLPTTYRFCNTGISQTASAAMSNQPFPPPSTLLTPPEKATLDRLHRAANSQQRSLILHYLPQIPFVLLGRGVTFKNSGNTFYNDKYISIGRAQGEFLHLLIRTLSAQTVVEFGTSFGVSTIYLASAVKQNMPRGKVITTELNRDKATVAKNNFREALVDDIVDLRLGDARETLKDVGQIDFVLLDGWPNLALQVLKVVEGGLRKGGVVAIDDVGLFKQDLREVVEYLSSGGYRVMTMPLEDGLFVAVKD